MIALALALACRPAAEPVDTGLLPTPAPESPLRFDGPVPRNLLMISLDTFRADALTRRGGVGRVPFLDRIADEGVSLDDHVGCSNWTFHATTCTLKGADPLSWGFVPRLQPTGGIAESVPAGTPFLSTWLGQAGFHTMLVTTNALLSDKYGNGTGYDALVVMPGLGTTEASVAGEAALQTLDDALAAGADRWFLHLHLMEPHRPYVPPEEYLTGLDGLPPIPWNLASFSGHDEAVWAAVNGLPPDEQAALEAHMRVRYEGELAWLDRQLSDLWETLDDRGLLDDALVVFWTDHGEQLFERGYQAHAFTLHREENDAVLMFWARGLQAATWSRPTWAIDLVPTLLELYGQPLPPEVTGLPLGRAPDDRPRFAFTSGKVGVMQTVRQGTDKLHFGWSDPAALDPWARKVTGVQRYDLSVDPGETVDRFAVDDPRSLELWELLRPEVERASALLPDTPVAWPEGLSAPTR